MPANEVCALCRLPLAPAERSRDHIVPVALGGTNAASNIQIAHKECNNLKGSLVPIVYCIWPGCHRRMHAERVASHWNGHLQNPPQRKKRTVWFREHQRPSVDSAHLRYWHGRQFPPNERVPLTGPYVQLEVAPFVPMRQP